VGAARPVAGERSRRQFSLLALRMDLELVSERHEKTLAETGQRVQLSRQASRTEKLLWAAALAPDDAEAQALFDKARELAAKDPGQRLDAAISTADLFRAFFPPGRLRLLAWHRRAGRPGRHRGRAVQQDRERAALLAGQRGCRLDLFPDPGIQDRVRVVRGVPVVVVALAARAVSGRAGTGRPGTGARPACRPGSGFPVRC
jgi:hypothetical protein